MGRPANDDDRLGMAWPDQDLIPRLGAEVKQGLTDQQDERGEFHLREPFGGDQNVAHRGGEGKSMQPVRQLGLKSRLVNHFTWLIVGLLACGDSGTGPSGHAPELGRYSFGMYFDDATSIGPVRVTYSGELVLTYAAEDSVAGFWNVGGLDSALDLGFYNVNGYLLYAGVHSGSRTFSTKVTPRSGGLTCSGYLIQLPNPTIPAPCTLDGPTGPP